MGSIPGPGFASVRRDRMIGFDRYKKMCADENVIMVALPTENVAGMMSDSDRLEAAIDEAMAYDAESCIRDIQDGDYVGIDAPLGWLRGWLGNGRSHCEWRKWDWPKSRIVELFYDGNLRERYVEGGWRMCEASYCSPGSHSILFEFRTHESPGSRAKTAARIIADRQHLDKSPDLPTRIRASIGGLRDSLGVERPGHWQFADMATFRLVTEYMENLHVAAKLMAFDLDMTRREAEADNNEDGGGPDGYFPPFEGSPDDDNFGN